MLLLPNGSTPPLARSDRTCSVATVSWIEDAVVPYATTMDTPDAKLPYAMSLAGKPRSVARPAMFASANSMVTAVNVNEGDVMVAGGDAAIGRANFDKIRAGEPVPWGPRVDFEG